MAMKIDQGHFLPVIRQIHIMSQGVPEECMTGGSDVFFWVENLHPRYFFGSRDLSRIF